MFAFSQQHSLASNFFLFVCICFNPTKKKMSLSSAEEIIPWSQFASEFYHKPSNRGKSWHKARHEASELYTDYKARRNTKGAPLSAPCDPNFEVAVPGTETCARHVGKAYPFEAKRAALKELRASQTKQAARLQAETNLLHAKYEAARATAKDLARKHAGLLKELGQERSEHQLQLDNERESWARHEASVKEAYELSKHTMHIELSKARIAERLLRARVQKIEQNAASERASFKRKLQIAARQNLNHHVVFADGIKAQADQALQRDLELTRTHERALEARLADLEQQLISVGSSGRLELEKDRVELKAARAEQSRLVAALLEEQKDATAKNARFHDEQARITNKLSESRRLVADLEQQKQQQNSQHKADLEQLRSAHTKLEEQYQASLERESQFNNARVGGAFAYNPASVSYEDHQYLKNQLAQSKARVAELSGRPDQRAVDAAKLAFNELDAKYKAALASLESRDSARANESTEAALVRAQETKQLHDDLVAAENKYAEALARAENVEAREEALQRNLEEAQKTQATLEARVSEMQKRNYSDAHIATASLNMAKLSYTQLMTKYDYAQSSLASVNSESAKAELVYERETDKLRAQISATEQKLAAVVASSQLPDARGYALERELAAAQKALSALQQQQSKDIEARVSEMQQKQTKSDAQLQQQVEQSKAEMEDARQEYAKLKKNYEDTQALLGSERASASAKIIAANRTLADAQRGLAEAREALRQSNQTKKSNDSDVQKQLGKVEQAALEAAQKALEKQRQLTDKIAAAQLETREANQQIKTIQANLDAAILENTKLRSEAKVHQQETAHQLEEATKALAEKKKLADELKNSQARVQQLQTDAAAATVREKDLASKLAESKNMGVIAANAAKEEMRRAQADAAELRTKYDLAVVGQATLAQKEAELLTKLGAVQAQLVAEQAEVSQSKGTLSEDNVRMEALRQESDALRNQLNDANALNTAAIKENEQNQTNLQRQLNDATVSLEASNKKRTAALQKIEALSKSKTAQDSAVQKQLDDASAAVEKSAKNATDLRAELEASKLRAAKAGDDLAESQLLGSKQKQLLEQANAQVELLTDKTAKCAANLKTAQEEARKAGGNADKALQQQLAKAQEQQKLDESYIKTVRENFIKTETNINQQREEIEQLRKEKVDREKEIVDLNYRLKECANNNKHDVASIEAQIGKVKNDVAKVSAAESIKIKALNAKVEDLDDEVQEVRQQEATAAAAPAAKPKPKAKKRITDTIRIVYEGRITKEALELLAKKVINAEKSKVKTDMDAVSVLLLQAENAASALGEGKALKTVTDLISRTNNTSTRVTYEGLVSAEALELLEEKVGSAEKSMVEAESKDVGVLLLEAKTAANALDEDKTLKMLNKLIVRVSEIDTHG